MDVPELLSREMARKGLDQSRFAEALGVDATTVSHWMRLLRLPSARHQGDIARVLGISLSIVQRAVGNTTLTGKPPTKSEQVAELSQQLKEARVEVDALLEENRRLQTELQRLQGRRGDVR